MVPSYTVLLDANVLYPAALRDLLMRLAMEEIFLARWTNQIHDEWIRNVLKNRTDLTLQQLHRTRDLMNAHVRDCLVTGYEPLIDALELPDPDDRHVLAAAIKAQAQAIITYNLSDFPLGKLEPFGIEPLHPDDFIVYQFDLNSAAVCRAVQKQRAALRNPPQSVQMLLDTFRKHSLPKTVGRLEAFEELL